jgi:hypothetical protein
VERVIPERELTAIAVRQSDASNAALTHFDKRQSRAATTTTQLDQLMAQTAAFYPHQEESKETAAVYRNAFKMLSERHGIDTLRQALLTIQLRPGQRFFPHPSEVSAELEGMAMSERNAARAANPRVIDPTCNHIGDGTDGMAWVIDKDGDRVLGRCKCYKRWKGQQPIRNTVTHASTP